MVITAGEVSPRQESLSGGPQPCHSVVLGFSFHVLCKAALWPLTSAFSLQNYQLLLEVVEAAGGCHKQTKRGFKEGFTFPIDVLLLDPALQKPSLPPKTRAHQTSVSLNQVRDGGFTPVSGRFPFKLF